MPFTSHLEELRTCLIRSALALIVAFAVCFSVVEHFFFILTDPILSARIEGLTLIGTSVPEAFFTKIKVAFFASIFLASPVILRESWRFVAPGLYEHEKRYARSFVFVGTLFFLLGAWFCYQVVFVYGFGFFLHRYQAIGVRPAIRIGDYLSFSARLLLAFGVIFELPIIAYFFTRIGLIDHRTMIRQFRYAIILIFLLAAVLTPPDFVAQLLLVIPLLLLYGVSIAVAYFARIKEPAP